MFTFDPITQDMYEYMLDVSLRETPAQQALRKATLQLDNAQMMSSPEQTQLLAFLVKLLGYRRVLEVGVFSGYTALTLAQALPADGVYVGCEINDAMVQFAQPFWQQAGVVDKINIKMGRALDTLAALIDNKQLFDLIYIDADKKNYPNYYELALQLLSDGGVIAFDNVLRIGRGTVKDLATPALKYIDQLNHQLKDDRRVDIVSLPTSGGLTLVRQYLS